MSGHDPLNFASGLGAKLATRSRHVCVFLGAGVGASCGLPDVAALQASLLDSLEAQSKVAFQLQLNGRSVEEALSRLRRIAALLEDDQTVDGLSGSQAAALDREVCQLIVKALSLGGADLKPVELFAAWVARAEYHLPLEIFTVNYDLLLETALEARGVPYFDGFVGNLEGSFRSELVEATPSDREWIPSFFARLWKLHGSVNWSRRDDDRVVRMGYAVPEGRTAAIYPSDMKYEESRRVPFVVLADRFRRSLQQPETLVLVSGYSFGDSHLDEVVFEAAARCERSETVALCYGQIPDHLAEQALATPNLQVVSSTEGIIGGIRADWETPEDPPPGLWEGNRFTLGDFSKLAAYLARSTAGSVGSNKLVDELLTAMGQVAASHEDGTPNA